MSDKVMEITITDQNVALMSKTEAHKQRVLHRAFSIFIIDNNENMLIQKRADNKYHSSGLLTNACCSHPVGEDVKAEATIRLKEELGITCKLDYIDKFLYYAEFENGLAEYELDYIYLGRYDSGIGIPFNRNEVSAVYWCPVKDLLIVER